MLGTLRVPSPCKMCPRQGSALRRAALYSRLSSSLGRQASVASRRVPLGTQHGQICRQLTLSWPSDLHFYQKILTLENPFAKGICRP